MAPDRQRTEMDLDVVIATYEAQYLKAAACLAQDREVLLAFYDFPAEHWGHIRTTDPIEATFATVRARTQQTPRMPLPCHDAGDGVQTWIRVPPSGGIGYGPRI